MVLILPVFLILPVVLDAQEFIPFTIDDAKVNNTLSINPDKPQPGEDFTVRISSFSFNTDIATFDFYKNGEIVRANGTQDQVGIGRDAQA